MATTNEKQSYCLPKSITRSNHNDMSIIAAARSMRLFVFHALQSLSYIVIMSRMLAVSDLSKVVSREVTVALLLNP